MAQDTMQKQTKLTIVNTHKLESVLLMDGEWHRVKDAELVPISVGSSPSSDPEYALKFTDKDNNQELFIPKRAIQGYQGNFSDEESELSSGYGSSRR